MALYSITKTFNLIFDFLNQYFQIFERKQEIKKKITLSLFLVFSIVLWITGSAFATLFTESNEFGPGNWGSVEITTVAGGLKFVLTAKTDSYTSLGALPVC
jgi:uncharacterized BrkB/YihY/UPF0761 family membrane protein